MILIQRSNTLLMSLATGRRTKMLTPAERKRRHHARLKKEGLVQKSMWLKPSVIAKIEAYKKHNNCTNAEAIEGLLL